MWNLLVARSTDDERGTVHTYSELPWDPPPIDAREASRTATLLVHDVEPVHEARVLATNERVVGLLQPTSDRPADTRADRPPAHDPDR